MTSADQENYRAAWAAQAKIAAQRGLAITGVHWQGGHMVCQMERPQRAAPAEPDPPSSSRGLLL